MFGWKNKMAATPQRMVEQTGAYDGGLYNVVSHGLVSGTYVASSMGWRPVEAITVGDQIVTFDNGLQTVTQIKRQTLWVNATSVPVHMWPVVVPAGALGNRSDMVVLPEQALMIESDAALDRHGDPFAVVAAAALVGVRGIFRQPPQQALEIVTLFFAGDQVIYTDGSVLSYCPRAHVSLSDLMSGCDRPYDVVSEHEAARLAASIVIEGDCAAYEHRIAC